MFETSALLDAVERLDLEAERLTCGSLSEVLAWIDDTGARQVVTPYLPQGPLNDWADDLRQALGSRGVTWCEWQRPWDTLVWPLATAGFFKVKKRIPNILHETGLV